MHFLTIAFAIFAIFDLTNANFYGGDFMSSYTGQDPNYGHLPIGLGFPSTGYSQFGPYLPPALAPVPAPAPAPAPAPVPTPAHPPMPVHKPHVHYPHPIFPSPFQSLFIPTFIDKHGRRHIRLGAHSFIQEEETDNGYGYPPSSTPSPATPPTPTTLAPTTIVITTPPQATTPSTSTATSTSDKGGSSHTLSFNRNPLEYDNSGNGFFLGNLLGVNEKNELVFLDDTQQATANLETATSEPDKSETTTTDKASPKLLNRKKTSKFHFKITPDNLLNIITL